MGRKLSIDVPHDGHGEFFLYLDRINVKVKDNNTIINKVVYIVIGINMGGKKEFLVLGLAKFWRQ